MKNILLLCFLLLLIPVYGGPASSFAEANKAYKEGRFNDAILLFESILDGGSESKEIYYNLGNSYYRIRNYPFAILSYERAKKMDPLDEDIDFNLQLANLKIVDKIEPAPRFFLLEWYSGLKDSLNSASWTTMTVGAFWLAVALFALFLYGRRSFVQKISFLASGGLLALSILFFVFAYQTSVSDASRAASIIIAPSVYVKSSPEDNSTDLFILREGAKVTVIESIGQWKEIKLADGKKGWLKQNVLEAI